MIEINQGIYLIDCFFAGLPAQCGAFLLRGEKNALIDTGPSHAAGHIIEALEELGVGEADLHYIALTHTHLDHAGGASFLLERFPRARIVVDEETSRYIVDPERLLKSAGRALGEIAPYYGTMQPVPADKIIPLRDGHRLDLGGGRSLLAVHTPGHSAGHFAFLEQDTGALFCGDSLGHLIADSGYIFPATPAPEFDLELSIASSGRLADLGADLLLFPHFGAAECVRETCDRFVAQLQWSLGVAEELQRAGAAPELLAAHLLRDMPQLKEGESGLITGIQEVNAAGMLHYLLKKTGQPGV